MEKRTKHGLTVGTVQFLVAIDPGPEESGVVCLSLQPFVTIQSKAIYPNATLLDNCRHIDARALVAIEDSTPRGQPSGRAVFDTLRWIGRFEEASRGASTVALVSRMHVLGTWCKGTKRGDTEVRAAMIELFGQKGTKGEPGPTYGFAKDEWAALAVAATHIQDLGWIYSNGRLKPRQDARLPVAKKGRKT